MGISPGAYAKVASVDNEKNLLTVERGNETLTYDPRRLQGVTVYRESEQAFSEGDRVQFTGPDKEHRIANRELGAIGSIDERGNVEIKLDSGREVRFNLEESRHLEYGYAVTSHSSQGATADQVLVNVDTEEAHEKLINSRLAYVAVSRARYDAQIYTNDAGNLGKLLSREVSHAAAVGTEDSGPAAEHSQAQQPGQDHGQAMAIEH
jgi:ATP-dependent exoDNAse (exonuclease V) alpha subunit